MMKIKKLEIKGFKSIDHLVLENVSPLMVLAGANGTGKSNIADALAFFSTVIDLGVDYAVKHFGGLKNLVCWKLPESEQNEMFFGLNIELAGQEYICSIKLGTDNHENFGILQELLYAENLKTLAHSHYLPPEKLQTENFEKSIHFRKILLSIFSEDNFFRNVFDENDNLKDYMTVTSSVNQKPSLLRTDTQIIPQPEGNNRNNEKEQFIGKCNKVIQTIRNIRIFRIDPVEAKKNSTMESHTLKSNGSNIAAVLSAWEHDDDFREQMLEWLQLIVPNMQTVQTESRDLDGAMMLGFQEKGMNKRFPAMLISDGTIYTLCILAAVLSRSREYGITIIEEPERGIHPQAIGELMSLMRESAGNKHMILLTTHSEAVIRNAEISEIYLVSKPDGSTRIHGAAASGVDKKQIPLDTAWLSNLFDGGLPW